MDLNNSLDFQAILYLAVALTPFIFYILWMSTLVALCYMSCYCIYQLYCLIYQYTYFLILRLYIQLEKSKYNFSSYSKNMLLSLKEKYFWGMEFVWKSFGS